MSQLSHIDVALLVKHNCGYEGEGIWLGWMWDEVLSMNVAVFSAKFYCEGSHYPAAMEQVSCISLHLSVSHCISHVSCVISD